MLAELNTLKTSTIGSSAIDLPSLNSREMRRSSAENVLVLRPVFRCTTLPSARMRSEGPATNGAWEGVPSGLSESGCAERYE